MEKPSSLFILAETVLSHTVWGICHEKDEISLSQHRERTEKKLQELTLSKTFIVPIKKCLNYIEQGYNDAFEWLRTYEDKIESFRNNELDVFLDEKFRLSNFITLCGRFDDVSWVNKFVDDGKRNVFDRFYFACFYCLVDKIPPLWREAQDKHICNALENCVHSNKPALVNFFISYVDLVEPRRFDWRAILDGCLIAASNGHEKALHYFFRKLPEVFHYAVKSKLERIVFHDTRTVIRYPKVTHYVFLNLAFEDSGSELVALVRELLKHDGYISSWHSYLHPQLISLMPGKIQRYQDALPEINYAHFFMKLVLKMTKIKNPLYQEMFQTIWRVASEINKRCFLENYCGVLWILFRSKDFVSARCLLKDASLEERKRFLFESIEELLFENASFRNDPQAVRNYLLLFVRDLQEHNSAESKPAPFHSESLNLLKEIQEKLHSAECSQREAVQKSVLPIVENLILEVNKWHY